MKLQFKILVFLLTLPVVVFANDPGRKGKYTKEKTIKKEFTVNADALLDVDNSYGNLDVFSWNENRIVIEVHIVTNSNNEEKAQRKLDEIDVEFSSSPSKVSAKTVFNKKSKSWKFWNHNNNVNMEINYTIKMPVTNSVDFNNDYGAININELEGHAKINCDYGQVNIGELKAENNDLNFDYTNNSTIGYMKSGNINADYSGFVLENVENLDLNADYTRSEINNVKTMVYSSDYGKLIVDNVGNIKGTGDYIPLKIQKLSGNMDVRSDYGSITVYTITKDAGDVKINSNYTGVKLGYEQGYHFNFTIDLSYAGFSGKDGLEVLRSEKDHTSKFYSGYHGSKDSGNTIDIDSDYGGVKLEQNF